MHADNGLSIYRQSSTWCIYEVPGRMVQQWAVYEVCRSVRRHNMHCGMRRLIIGMRKLPLLYPLRAPGTVCARMLRFWHIHNACFPSGNWVALSRPSFRRSVFVSLLITHKIFAFAHVCTCLVFNWNFACERHSWRYESQSMFCTINLNNSLFRNSFAHHITSPEI